MQFGTPGLDSSSVSGPVFSLSILVFLLPLLLVSPCLVVNSTQCVAPVCVQSPAPRSVHLTPAFPVLVAGWCSSLGGSLSGFIPCLIPLANPSLFFCFFLLCLIHCVCKCLGLFD